MADGAKNERKLNAIVSFFIKSDQTQNFISFMNEYLKDTVVFSGCDSIQLIQDEADTQRFYILEQWASPDAEKKYLAWRASGNSTDGLGEMLAEAPSTRYGVSVLNQG